MPGRRKGEGGGGLLLNVCMMPTPIYEDVGCHTDSESKWVAARCGSFGDGAVHGDGPPGGGAGGGITLCTNR